MNMMDQAVEVGFSLMLSGPRMRTSLPEGFDKLPELSSPISAGFGARSFDFLPHGRDPGISDDYGLAWSAVDSQGNPVELFEPRGSTPQWFLKWSLSRGNLYTHLRSQDEVDQARAVIDGLTIEEEGGTPFLLLDPPLKSAVSARVGYQETVSFVDDEPAERMATIQRPGYLRRGEMRAVPADQAGEWAAVRAGGPHGLEVIVSSQHGRADARETVKMILDNLRESVSN
jgi:hypothetical protein